MPLLTMQPTPSPPNKKPWVFSVVILTKIYRGIARYTVFGTDTVKKSISCLLLPCTAQPNVITMVSESFPVYRIVKPVTVLIPCLATTTFRSRWNELSKKMNRLLVKLPVRTHRLLHAQIYGFILYLALGQGLGTAILCQILDTAVHHTETIPYPTVPHPATEYCLQTR